MVKKELQGILNPAMAFITQEEQTAQQQPLKEKLSREGKPRAHLKHDTAQGIVKNRYGQESKTKRLNLVIKPSTHSALEQIAKTDPAFYGSVNNLINRVLEEYISTNT